MFRMSKMKNRAIVSDVNSVDPNTVSKDRVGNIHKNGLNVLYANGGARWVDEGLYTKQFGVGITMTNNTADYLHDQIWNNFDADKQLY